MNATRPVIGVTLIVCGAGCIGGALAFAAFFANLLFKVQGPLGDAVRESGPFIALTFLALLFGVVFALTGVLVGLRGASKSTRSASDV